MKKHGTQITLAVLAILVAAFLVLNLAACRFQPSDGVDIGVIGGVDGPTAILTAK
jgi:Na+-transporting methylmalonyl-CoA/oxaloacetate decarboxylase beta subunit